MLKRRHGRGGTGGTQVNPAKRLVSQKFPENQRDLDLSDVVAGFSRHRGRLSAPICVLNFLGNLFVTLAIAGLLKSRRGEPMSDHAITDAQIIPAVSKPPRDYAAALVLGSGGLVTLAWLGLLGRGALWLIGY